MKTEENRKVIRWYILGAIGGILMAAGDWLLGCIPLQETDTGMFNRAYYLSGSYGLWRPVLIVGFGAIGCFLYYFMVKALNADIARVMQVPVATWMSVMSQSSTNTSIVIWCVAAAIYGKKPEIFLASEPRC